MKLFDDLSIRRKLLVIVLVAIFVASFTQTVIVLQYEDRKVREELSNELTALALITAERSSAALIFQHDDAVLSNLQSLLLQENIEQACVYDDKAKVFVSTNRRPNTKADCPPLENVKTGVRFFEDRLRVLTPIVVRDRTKGHLLLEANLHSVRERLVQYLWVSIAVAVFSAALAYLVTMQLTGRIANPITALARMAARIRETEDYSQRAEVVSGDETGQLVQNFNEMVKTTQHAQLRMNALVLELQERSEQIQANAEKVASRHDAIREYFSGVSHDLRQPLQAIDMYVTVLKNAEHQQDRQSVYNKLHDAVSNMGNMFRELLDVARFEAQVEKDATTVPVELEHVVRRIAQEFEVLAADKGLRFRLHNRPCTVLSDATMLERGIRNLISNAIRYTETGGVLLAVRPRRDEVWIDIWDTGRGIPEEKRESIFKQFVQADIKDADKGHGLGLSIVKRLFTALGHPLDLKSREGRGTLFRLRLPLVRADGSAAATTAAPPPAKAATATADVNTQLEALSGKLKVCIVDDDPLVLDAVTQLLQSWGMGVVAFTNPAALRQWAAETDIAPSLLISDYNLSDTEVGTDLIAELRRQFEAPIPALVITGNNDPQVAQRIKDAGIQLLKKPIRPPRLRAMINFLVTQSAPD